MLEIIIFFSFFYFFLISVIGFGIFFQKVMYGSIQNLYDQKIIFTGFYGLFLLSLISLFTSIFFSHNFVHNALLHLVGILFFIIFKFTNKKEYIKIIFLISIFTISALLISKTHDDFSYYHLPFTQYLSEQKIIFGVGNLSHGFKLISSLFFLNSTFYLPFIKHFSFHFSLMYFFIFFNYFLLKEVLSKNSHEIIKYLYLFAFIFFNLSFNRLSEFGTDKAGQLLIVIMVIKFLQLSCFNENKKDFKNILILIPLLGFCITLKTYFLPYILIGLMVFLLNEKFLIILKNIFYSKVFLIFILSLSIYFFHHFVSTGCLISPVSVTCFGDGLEWAYDKSHYKGLSNWFEQWAKSGAGPNFRIEDPNEYIKNFNWISRWFEYYFMGKVKDQLLLITFAFLFIFYFFKKFKLKSENLTLNRNILFFYLIIIAIFFIWFTNHPQLRYGGYSINFLILSLPLAILFYKFENKNSFRHNLKILIVFVIVVFNVKNILRINDEFNRTDHYKFNNFPFFSIPEKKYISEKTYTGLIVYKTSGHCWNVPSPCVQSLDKLSFDTKKKYGYYFFYR